MTKQDRERISVILSELVKWDEDDAYELENYIQALEDKIERLEDEIDLMEDTMYRGKVGRKSQRWDDEAY